MILRARHHEIHFPRRPLVMGIVNINDDSFSGDGTLNTQEALQQAKAHLAAGADIIDVGAESARTNREAISPTEEIGRLQPFLDAFPALVADSASNGASSPGGPLLAVNSWRPEVVREVLPMGVDLLNDIGALHEDDNARLCAETGAALLIMHSVGLPKQPHPGQHYPDVIGEMQRFFEQRLASAVAAGLEEERIVLDPGLDFAKDRADNLKVLRDLTALHRHGRPLLLPVSRKTVIGDVLGLEDPANRDAGTIALAVGGAIRGAGILRVHNVSATFSALRILEATCSAWTE